MKLILLVGEKMSNMVPREYKTMVCYGMTETMPFATCFILDKAYDIVPIGKSCNGISIYLMDEDGNPCDEGEICVAGGIGKSYWNRPELTEKTFVPNPFATGEHDKVLLHTGDIGKRLPGGNLLFLNRNDWMVKISGQRVEPGEIGNVKRQKPEIKQAVVKDFVNERGLTYLCGFYTMENPVSETALCEYMAKKMPDYMLPRFLVQLDSFPVNSNGKLDRLSLQAPKVAEFQGEYVTSETSEEELLCHAFETILDVKPVGVFDDFFHMGGDSLGVISLMVEAEKLHLNAEVIFKGKTPRRIAALLQKNGAKKVDCYSDCQEERMFYPLTSSQRFMFRAYLADPLSTTFNISAVYQFPLDVDANRIREALLAVFAYYPILKVKVIEQDGVYGMLECPERSLDIQIVAIKELDIPKKEGVCSPP